MSLNQFIDASLMQLTVGAAFRRTKIYRSETVEDTDRRSLARTFASLIRREALKHDAISPVSDEAHFQSILSVARDTTAVHRAILNGGRLNIGIAQKGLNLYLKYLWNLGLICTPPHCPFDATILAIIADEMDDRFWVNISWSEIDDLDLYMELIDDARIVAGDLSLAEWELLVFQTESY